ncbi:MAG: ribonuclease J [Clostridia bacterium]|nr:ribonuclease J [Clostridia bacterium]
MFGKIKNRRIIVAKKKTLKVIPLGGLHEIGKNLTAIEYGDIGILIDCGVAFPDENMLGVDLVIPDYSYIIKNQHKFKALVLTHGHEDHIGGIPYLMKDCSIPVFGTKLTIGLVKFKLKEHNLLTKVALNQVTAGDTLKFGDITVEFIHTNHSIADSVAIAVHTPEGIILHTGDFKIDTTPVTGNMIDLARFGQLGKQGVTLLMSESTNAERHGYTQSERSVGKALNDIFITNPKKRIIIATFASNVHRVQQIIDASVRYNRKVAVSGRSMENVVQVAQELGYMKIPKGTLIDIDNIKNYNNEHLTIITTGSQGEPMSGLHRMAFSAHRKVEITSNDLVVLSANPIPGNEKLVSTVVNELFKRGSSVVYDNLADVHVSGHACQEELKLILALTKPKYFMPIHGEYKHLIHHKNLAMEVGIPEDRIHILQLGNVLQVSKTQVKPAGSVPSGKVFVAGLSVGDVGNIVLRDRKHLSQDGLIVIVVSLSAETGQILSGPDIISRGFVYMRDSEDLMEETRQVAKEALEAMLQRKVTDWASLKNEMRSQVSTYLTKKTKRSPMILPIIMEV